MNGKISMETLMEAVYAKLVAVYSFQKLMVSFNSVLIAALTAKVVNTETVLEGTSHTIDTLLSYGLIRLTPIANTLDIPYILLYIAAKYSGDPILSRFPFHKSAEWKDFEEFIAHYTCLRTQLLKDGEMTSLADYHHGARWSNEGEAKLWQIKNRRADTVICSSTKLSTATSPKMVEGQLCGLDFKAPINIAHASSTSDITPGTCVVRNGEGATAADVFRTIEITYPSGARSDVKGPLLVYESMQCKCYNSYNRTRFEMNDYVKELDKASSKIDVFIAFVTRPTTIFSGVSSLPTSVDDSKYIPFFNLIALIILSLL
jgi:hypothetical protein